MQYSIHHISRGSFAFTVVAMAAIAVLFLLGSSARASAVDDVAAVATPPGEDVPAPAEPIPTESASSPAPIPTPLEEPEPVQTTRAVSEPVDDTVASVTSDDTDTPSVPQSVEGAAAESVRIAAAAPSSVEGAAAESVRIVSETSMEATAPAMHAAKAATNAIDPGTATKTIGRVAHLDPELAQRPLQLADRVLPKEPIDLSLSEGRGGSPLLAGVASERGGDALSHPAMPGNANPPASLLPGERTSSLDDLLVRHPRALGAAAQSSTATPALVDPSMSGSRAASVDAGAIHASDVDPGGKRLADATPRDGEGPHPSPESPQDAASAVSSPSSAPVVALLALLALAAPAIFRRLREVPDARAQTRFVCALECPG